MADPVGFEWKADWRPPGQLGRWASRTGLIAMPRHLPMYWFVVAACIAVGCAHKDLPERKVGAPQEQKINGLTEADQSRLHISVPLSSVTSAMRIQSRNTKPLLGSSARSAILQGNVFRSDQTYELQCLGIVLGDALVQEMRIESFMVEDEYGRDPAIRVPNTTIILYPMTMISKRLERDETVDVFELFNGLAAQIEELQRQDN